MKRTDLFEAYNDSDGVKFTDFGGWELPLHFKDGILEEHMSVRENMGMFDVSHMGECFITGSDALKFLNLIITNDISVLEEGRALYTIMCYENGTSVDDLIIYRLKADEHEVYKFFMVMNASNVEKDLKHILSYKDKLGFKDLNIEDVSSVYCQIALQGPNSLEFIKKNFSDYALDDVYSCKTFNSMIIGRTGYTGEQGYELYFRESEKAILTWKKFKELGVKECGLGSRDTLRLEAKLPLYGHELSEEITPLEANLSAFVILDKECDFIGKQALIKQKEEGIPRSLRGFKVKNGVARNSYRVFYNDKDIGYVTSGAYSPVLNEFICLALVNRNLGLKFGNIVFIDIHGKKKEAELVKTPFVKHT